MLTKGNFTRDEWNHLLRVLNIMNLSLFSCSRFSPFLSDPMRKQCAMSKSVQESNLKEGLAVAKPKPTKLNFESFRKVPSREVRDPNSPGNHSLDQHGVSARSWKRTARTTNENPTMFSQERQQSDPQTSNTRKQGRRDESSNSARSWKLTARREVNQPRRRKREFHNMQISDSGYLEKVFKNLRKNVILAEDCTVSGDRSVEDQRIDLVNVNVDNN